VCHKDTFPIRGFTYCQKTLDEMNRIGNVEIKRAVESFVEKKTGLEF